ncbi:MAG: UDP-N-acetylglucosamine 1-carboxyvinyltransferase [Firmicutes bacterium]|nr:UDP-N-acetylglucosamine 1-carboxyvinyltransferase [Bacillota bacterium]MDD7602893.1 UDP-N-acetylglucosamine 1-carboxyvinyltransferase [Bacillota bacterium]MDY5856552.1 UDP-N-acetylglucosamine 1-carboxyvinyltransferase [Anaerovoracaceae bacterium]
MGKYLVHHSGPLSGEVVISGAKNAVLPLMAAALLSEDKCVIRDVPQLRDVAFMKEILTSLGAEIEEVEENTISIVTEDIVSTEAQFDLVNKMRASILVMGPLLARKGRARMPLPGGCAIGARPIDLHLKGLEALGAEIIFKDTYVEARAGGQGLIGDTIYLDFPSVGATENIMMAAVLAEGVTFIENAAEEPEIVDLANFLNKMGARIKGAGTDTIKIEGVKHLSGAKHTVIPDRIEAGTFMLAAAITRGNVRISNAVPDHLKPIIAKLRECGVRIEVGDEYLIVRGDLGPQSATDIKTLPYPGFPTDIQSPFMAYLTTVEGASTVIETVFENRFMHVSQLRKMGASIETAGNKAIIKGNASLRGTQVMATDLRAGAALVLAGLAAEGVTEISEIYHIERGYEKFIEKFRGLGAVIERIDD